MSNPAPTLNQINAFNATQGTTIDFNIIGGTEVIRSNKIYIYDLSDNSLICTHLYVSTESIHELPPNTSSSIVYASGKSSADFTNNTQYYAQIQTFTDVGGTQGGSGLSIAKLFWCLPTPTLTLSTIPTTISTTSYNVSATYTPNTSGGATNEIQEFQFNLYSAIGALLQTSGVVLYGEGVDLSYNFSGLEVDSTYYVTLDVTTTQGMNVSAQSNTFTVSIDTPTMGSASVVNNGCDGYISVTSNLSSEYEHEESAEAGEIMSFTTDSVNDITELDVDFSPVQNGTPWMSTQDTTPYMFRPVPSQTEDFGHESDTIVGGTVGWNQLFPLGSDSWKVVNESIDVTATNGRIVATGTPTASNTSTLFPSRIYNQIKPIYGHKYFLYVYGTTNFNIGFGIYGTPTKTTQIGVLNGDGSKIIACETANSTDAELIGSFTNGSPVSADFHSHFIDLTAYFGTTIADYVYTLESGTAGAGVAWLKENAPQLFKYNAYDAGSLVSVSNLTAHVMRDADDNVIGSYPLDSTLTLRGIPKLDASNNLYYDGDRYNADGSVDRRYREVDLASFSWNTRYTGSTNKALSVDMTGYAYKTVNGVPNMIGAPYSRIESVGGVVALNDPDNKSVGIYSYTQSMSGIAAYSTIYIVLPKNDSPSGKLVYELATPTTESADPYTNPQIVDPHGTEEYVGSPIPVGHETTYQRICPITGWTGCEVDVAGVNLIDEANTTIYRRYFQDLGDKNVWTSDAGSGSFAFICKPNTTYTVSCDNSSIALFRVGYIDVDPDALASSESPTLYGVVKKTASGSTTITTGADAKAVIVQVNNAIATARTAKLQIELGSTATPYTPYQGTTYTSTFPKYKQQVSQDKTPYITKNIGDTYADTLTENLVGGTIAWNQSVPDTTTTHTVSGSIASMNDAVAGNFESVVCDIEPVQDLHGYDKPWVGGAGKNKIPSISATFTDNDVTWTLNSDGSVKLSGTATANSVYDFGRNIVELEAGTYFANETVSGYSVTVFSVIGGTASVIKSGGGQFTLTEKTSVFMRVLVASGSTPNVTIYPQIEKGTSFTGYAPYENLCPITGWTGCEVSQTPYEQTEKHTITGKNIYNAPDVPNGVLVPCHIADDVTVTASCSGSNNTIRYYNANKEQIDYWNLVNVATDGRYYRNFTTSGGIEYVEFTGTQREQYMIELNTATPSAYEPYGYHYPVSWQTEAGTVYGGTVDVVTGVLTVDRIVFESTISALNNGGTTGNYQIYNKANVFSGETIIMDSSQLCNIAEYKYDSSASTHFYCVASGYFVLYVPIGTSTSTTIQLCCKLATPITYQLDPVQVACLLGQNNVWNNISNTTVTYPTNHSYQSLSTTHKYYKRLNGVESISVGSDVVADVGTDNIIDLTQMFGTTIADYIYNREQSSSSGMGVKFFKSLFPNDDYDYNSGELISVNASAHVIKDANGNVLHTYPLDSDLVLRGIPKLDANNKLYYDGDVYESDGSVTRKYGIVDLGQMAWTYDSTNQRFYTLPNPGRPAANKPIICAKYPYVGSYTNLVDKTIANIYNDYVAVKDTAYNDANAFKTAMSGVYLVYELNTQTTEQADPFEENQAIVPNGIEEYIVTEQGDVEMPVGHDSTYYATEVYGGTIDMANGVLTINMASVDLGSLNWNRDSGTGAFYANLTTKKAGLCSLFCENLDWYPYSFSFSDYANIPDNVIANNNGASNVTLYAKCTTYTTASDFKAAMNGVQLVYELETPIEISLTPQQMQTLSGQNNIWSNTNGGMYLVYQLPITSLLVKRRDVADVSGKWLTLYSTPITQASDMDFTFIDFLNQYGKKYQYALVPVLAQDQSGVIVQIEGGYTVSDNVDSIFDGVYIADQTNVERVKAGVGYGNIDMNQGVGSITPIGSKYPIVITNSQNQYHNGSVRGTIVPNDFYSNGNLSRIDMVNKRDELEQFLTNKRAKIIKDWNGKMWLVMIMSNVACSFDDNYGMGMVSFSADWLEVGDPTNQQDLYNAGLINVGGV